MTGPETNSRPFARGKPADRPYWEDFTMATNISEKAKDREETSGGDRFLAPHSGRLLSSATLGAEKERPRAPAWSASHGATCIMDETGSAICALEAANVMHHDFVVLSRQTPVREVARILHRARANGAPVVDEQGRCVGIVLPADILRWVDAGCPETVMGALNACPYQVRGRLLTGEQADICMLAHGSCLFQAARPTTGGRHTELCMRQTTQELPFGAAACFVTTDNITVRAETHLPDLWRRMLDQHIDRLVVVDENDRPNGIVSALDILAAIVNEVERGRGA
jgi:CBS domain-containing protein